MPPFLSRNFRTAAMLNAGPCRSALSGECCSTLRDEVASVPRATVATIDKRANGAPCNDHPFPRPIQARELVGRAPRTASSDLASLPPSAPLLGGLTRGLVYYDRTMSAPVNAAARACPGSSRRRLRSRGSSSAFWPPVWSPAARRRPAPPAGEGRNFAAAVEDTYARMPALRADGHHASHVNALATPSVMKWSQAPRVVVSFSGLDGAGKTRQIDALVRDLDRRGRTEVLWVPFRMWPEPLVTRLPVSFRSSDPTTRRSGLMKTAWAGEADAQRTECACRKGSPGR
jgi:hypothetical protein